MSKNSIKICSLLILLICNNSFAFQSGKGYALLIGGLGGNAEYSEKYNQYLLNSYKAFTEKFGFDKENVIVLAEKKPEGSEIINDISKRENIEKYFTELSQKITPTDDLFVLMFGHGSFNRGEAFLNIPRKDLSDTEYGKMLDKINAKRIVFVIASSASAPFIDKLSSQKRIIITATKSGTQKNQPLFAGNFVEALSSTSADMDKNGSLSVLEAFNYASDKTARWYTDNKHLATEHPQLEDTGDKISYRHNELIEFGEGSLAAMTLFNRNNIYADLNVAEGDSTVIKLILEQEEIEQAIAEHKKNKSDIGEDEYYDKLEVFMLKLTDVNLKLDDLKKK